MSPIKKDETKQVVQNNHSTQSKEVSDDLRLRIEEIEGQIRRINNMVKQGECCDDILIHVNTVQSALCSVGRIILENRVKQCLKKNPGLVDDQTINELFVSIKRLHQIGN